MPDNEKKKPESLPMIQNVNQQNDPMLESPQMNQIPMYQHGGDVPKDQVAHVDAGERVLNPTEAHAYRSAAAGEAPPTLLGRIADRAHEIYNQGKALVSPMNSEADALKEKQQNVNAAQHQMAEENKPLGAINYAPVAADRVHPGAVYGSRPGEQRIDTSNMMKPLGAAPAAAKLPVYDEGGDVPEDQVAKLGAGEHVLDPDKAAAYRQAEAEVKAEHGAPADFGGQVMPNPKGIKVQSDTEQPDIGQRLSGGAKMNTDLAPHGGPKMDTSNTPMNEMTPGMEREASARTTPLGNTGAPRPTQMKQLPTIESPMGNGTTDVPQSEQEREEASVKNAGYTVQHQAPNPEHAAIIQQDKEEAAKKGDLVGLGKAMINEKLFDPKRDVPQMPVTPTAPSPEEGLKNEKEELHHKMLYGQTPEERFSAERDLAELQRKTPWGSAENHPGMLGKILHGVSSVAQGAARGVAPYVLPSIPGSQMNIAAHEQAGTAGVEGAQKEQANAAEIKLKEAQARMGGAKTPSEQVYMHAVHGGPDGGPAINPDTQKPYTDAEALELSTGAGKAPLQQAMNYLQKQVNPDTGVKYTPEEAFAKASFDASNAKMNERQKRVADYVHAHNMEDTPANRETARIALETADVNAKALAALPYAEQKTKFGSDLATTRALLVQQNADANQRGLKADELQNTENARFDKVINQIQLAKDALESSDTSQFAANVVPVIATLTTTSAEGVKRINKQELDRFLPADGSLGRWASAHVDKWLAGEIPPEYKAEVGKFLDNLGRSFAAEHTSNTKSIDDTVRQGAQQPTQKPTGGVGAPEKSKPQTIERHVDVPATAQSQYKDKAGNVVGYKDANGAYVPLNK